MNDSLDIIRDNMRGKLCPRCYATIYLGDFHNCPAESSDFTLLHHKIDVLQKQLEIAINTLKRIRGTTYPNGVPDSMLANDALREIYEIGNDE